MRQTILSICAILLAAFAFGCAEKPPKDFVSLMMDRARMQAAQKAGVLKSFKIVADISSDSYVVNQPPSNRTVQGSIDGGYVSNGTYTLEDRVHVYEHKFKLVSDQFDATHKDLASKEVTVTAKTGFRRSSNVYNGETFVHWQISLNEDVPSREK